MKIAIFILAIAQLAFVLSNAERTGGPASPFEFVTFLVLVALPSLVLATYVYAVPETRPKQAASLDS